MTLTASEFVDWSARIGGPAPPTNVRWAAARARGSSASAPSLARSEDPWAPRTPIVAAIYFVRKRDTADKA